MAATATHSPADVSLANSHVSAKLAKRPGKLGMLGFLIALVIGLVYAASQLISDVAAVRSPSIFPYVILGISLLIALGFEFVNGFHDTANAVATVIYTHSLDPHVAVMWSGIWNFIGVLVSTGTVAFGIVSLLPVELILRVGSHAGFAMVFALLAAAIVWNLGTWWLGLPSSSSHTLIGSIIGVGIANQLLAAGKTGTSGVDWGQAANVGKSLLISPLVGFASAALLLLLMKAVIPNKRLYEAPEGDAPPPLWIRALLVLTCTGVSFAHGSNDGQKGMGLIMLILIGTVPTAYALNHAVTATQMADFVSISAQAEGTLARYSRDAAPADPNEELTRYIRSREMTAATVPALRAVVKDIAHEVSNYTALKDVPPEKTTNVRNEMYLASEAIRVADKAGALKLSAADAAVVKKYKKQIDDATKFIPPWVKVAVAIALGLGTMVGWKRIVVTVGEKIGKDHLTYAQGAAAEITAMVTIGAADVFGLPVSTTHVLSSGIAGTMAANKTGLQGPTVRNLVLAWVLTMPVSMVLSGVLYWIFRSFG
jgi:PiT family inorganic phosphate transporter